MGYTFQLNAATLSAGTHPITVSTIDSDARPDTGSASVTVNVGRNDADPPLVVIDSPVAGASVSGMITIAGWAIDNATVVGTAIAALRVSLDGAVIGNATYGIGRPDVCNNYPGRPGCPNVGYIFQKLNTLTLSPGSHIITVTAIDKDGTPDSGSASVTVNLYRMPPTVFIESRQRTRCCLES